MEIISKEELAELILANQSGMYRLAYSILGNEADAQDAVGESIVRAFENRKNLKKKNSAKSWLMKILVNVSRSAVAKKQRLFLTAEPERYSETMVFQDDELWSLIMELQEEFRTVIILYYYERLTTKEISKMLGMPEGTVKTWLSRGRKKLAKILSR